MSLYTIQQCEKQSEGNWIVASEDHSVWCSLSLDEEDIQRLKKHFQTEDLVGQTFESPEFFFHTAIEKIIHPPVLINDLTEEVIVPALVQGISPPTRYIQNIQDWVRTQYGRDYLEPLNAKLAPHHLKIQVVDENLFETRVKGECIYCQLVSEKGTRNLVFTPSMDVFIFEEDL